MKDGSWTVQSDRWREMDEWMDVHVHHTHDMMTGPGALCTLQYCNFLVFKVINNRFKKEIFVDLRNLNFENRFCNLCYMCKKALQSYDKIV